MATWCIVQRFHHHGDGRGDTSVDKTMYMKSNINCCCIPFVLYLPSLCLGSNTLLVQSFLLVQPSTHRQDSSMWRVEPELYCNPHSLLGRPESTVPRHSNPVLPYCSRPAADIRRVAQASPAQHCRLSDSQARNLSSSTRALLARRPEKELLPPIEPPSTNKPGSDLQLNHDDTTDQPTLVPSEDLLNSQPTSSRKSKCSARPSSDPPPPPPRAGPSSSPPPPAEASPRSSRDLPSPRGPLPPPPPPSRASPAGTRCGATLLAPACPRWTSRGASPACWLGLIRCVCFFASGPGVALP